MLALIDWQQIADGFLDMDLLGWGGFVFGVLAVLFLIRENILTWPAGIIYCVISFFIFWPAGLYQDFFLHIFFLVMNIYGWITWSKKNERQESALTLSFLGVKKLLPLLIISAGLIYAFGNFFEHHFTDLVYALFKKKIAPSYAPYFDATTNILSLSAMWLTAKKKIESWWLWFVVDAVASYIYFKKGLDYYGFLYLIYLGMAVTGYINWMKLYRQQQVR